MSGDPANEPAGKPARRVGLGIVWLAGAAVALAIVSAGAGALAHRAGLTNKITSAAARTWGDVTQRVFPKPESDLRQVQRRQISTGLVDLEETTIPLGPFSGEGGSIVELGDGLLFVEPNGAMGYASFEGHVRYLDQRAPINMDAMIEWLDTSGQAFPLQYFRTLDSLLTRDADGSQTLFVSHSRFNGDCVEFVVSAIGVSAEPAGPVFDAAGWRTVYVAKPCIPLPPQVVSFSGHEAGGRMIEVAPGQLLVTVGHFAFDGVHLSPPMSQDPGYDLGKILSIDIRTGAATIFARGLRNPQGLMQDSLGRIWETEHGPQGGDEVNLVRQGADLGWPSTTFGMLYGNPRNDWPANAIQGRHDPKFDLPVYFFVPSVGPSSLLEVQGSEFPEWQGDLLVASLKATKLFRMRMDGARVLSVEEILIGERIRDMIELSDMRLALLTDLGNVKILGRAGADSPSPNVVSSNVTSPNVEPDTFTGFADVTRSRAGDSTRGRSLPYAEHGKRLFVNYCSSCHSLDGSVAIGPSLRGVIGREVASTPNYAYSAALKQLKGRWSKDRLVEYVEEPQLVAPGGSMSKTALNYYDILAAVDYIQSQ